MANEVQSKKKINRPSDRALRFDWYVQYLDSLHFVLACHNVSRFCSMRRKISHGFWMWLTNTNIRPTFNASQSPSVCDFILSQARRVCLFMVHQIVLLLIFFSYIYNNNNLIQWCNEFMFLFLLVATQFFARACMKMWKEITAIVCSNFIKYSTNDTYAAGSKNKFIYIYV